MAKFNMKRDPTAGLVPAGVHRFVVEKVEERTGPNGPYLNLSLRVYVNNVKWNAIVFEVLSTSIESKFRVDQFFDSVGAPEEGVADDNWFLNKTGWAKFDHKPDRDGVMRSRVTQYLTEEAAENIKSKQAFGDDDAPATSRSPSSASTPVRKSGGKKAAVAEMEEEDSPF